MNPLIELDKRHVWHPFTQHATECDPIAISHAKDASLYDVEGREILDLISSWWTCTHGHSHPALNKALSEQAEKMPHIMFAGFTHEPAVELSRKLSELLAEDLNRVFFSDNGSTSVEVAMKLVYQYWLNKGQDQRKTFIAFDGAYHGDTLGAMSVGKGSGFFNLFEGLMCEVRTVPYAPTWYGDNEVQKREGQALKALEALLQSEGNQIAGLIIEPLMQGAAGMRFCRPEFIRQIVEISRANNILVIFDEIATGFGRTGTLFATDQVGIAPDVICLSKGLTAGYMPMSVTVARDSIFDVFLGDDFGKALAHGHSFTANPLACAVALESLNLFETEKTLQRISQIQKSHQEFLPVLEKNNNIVKPRVMGTVLACDFIGSDGYKSKESLALRDWYLSRGFNIRPLGSTLYMMPPYCIADMQINIAHEVLVEGIAAVFEY